MACSARQRYRLAAGQRRLHPQLALRLAQPPFLPCVLAHRTAADHRGRRSACLPSSLTSASRQQPPLSAAAALLIHGWIRLAIASARAHPPPHRPSSRSWIAHTRFLAIQEPPRCTATPMHNHCCPWKCSRNGSAAARHKLLLCSCSLAAGCAEAFTYTLLSPMATEWPHYLTAAPMPHAYVPVDLKAHGKRSMTRALFAAAVSRMDSRPRPPSPPAPCTSFLGARRHRHEAGEEG